MNPEFYSVARGVSPSALPTINERLNQGVHVHAVCARVPDEYCAGGDSNCPLYDIQVKEAIETWR